MCNKAIHKPINKNILKETTMKKSAAWLNTAIFYEIYPQSFQDTNADGIGDFQGIIKRLDYIKELGCNAIWMNPCFKSPFYDAGYDVEDFYTVAPRYGTNEDLKELFEEVHKRDMHILLDLVPGHTAITHPWFKESMKAAKNEYTDRYIWTDSVWESIPDMGSLHGISERMGSAIVNFFSHQPALNYGFYKPDPKKPWQQSVNDEGPQATLEEMKNVMRFYLGMGCDGFRVDMAHSMVKEDPEKKGTIKLWQNVRQFLDEEFPNAVMVSEWGEPDKALKGGFHMDFLLHFGPSHYNDLFRCDEPFFSTRGKGAVKEFVDKYLDSRSKAGKNGLICIPSGNHDMPRLSHCLNTEELKMAFAFLYAMPGAPFLYYGDEIGMRYLDGIPSVEGGYERTGARTPMQWDNGTNAGFSTAKKELLYIRQDDSKDRPNVENQLKDPDSLLRTVQSLIAFRQSHAALRNDGDIKFIQVGYPLVFERSSKTETITVIVNPSSKPCTVKNVKGDILYTVGNTSTKEKDTVQVAGASVLFVG